MSGPLPRMPGCARAGVVAWLLLLAPGPAAAHPHVFVDYAVTVLLAGDAVDGIRLTWTFDDLFSGFILQEFDTDRNQTLSPQEIRRIEEKHLTEFQRAGYYTTVNVNGKPAVLPPARGFSASVAKGIVTYEFVLSVRASLATTTALEVLVDDPGLLHRVQPRLRDPAGPGGRRLCAGLPRRPGQDLCHARCGPLRDPAPMTRRGRALCAAPARHDAGRGPRRERSLAARSVPARQRRPGKRRRGPVPVAPRAPRSRERGPAPAQPGALARASPPPRGRGRRAALGVAWIAFLYGVLHAIGPGHGKLVISSLFLAREARLGTAVAVSGAVSLLQTVSAVAIVSVVTLALGRSGFDVFRDSRRIELVSYGLIAVIGLVMLVAAIRELWGHRHAGDRPPVGLPGEGDPPSRRVSSGLVLATGLTPCASAVIILLFALGQGVFLVGIAASLVMAVGMGLTVSLVGILAVLTRRGTVRAASRSRGVAPWVKGAPGRARRGGDRLPGPGPLPGGLDRGLRVAPAQAPPSQRRQTPKNRSS